MTAVKDSPRFVETVVRRLRQINKKASLLRRKQNARLIYTARIISIFFIVVAGFDAITTNAALGAGQMEGNPVIKEVQDRFGEWWLAPKVLFHLMLAMLILWFPSRKMITMARLVVVGYLAIFLNNAYFAGWWA